MEPAGAPTHLHRHSWHNVNSGNLRPVTVHALAPLLIFPCFPRCTPLHHILLHTHLHNAGVPRVSLQPRGARRAAAPPAAAAPSTATPAAAAPAAAASPAARVRAPRLRGYPVRCGVVESLLGVHFKHLHYGTRTQPSNRVYWSRRTVLVSHQQAALPHHKALCLPPQHDRGVLLPPTVCLARNSLQATPARIGCYPSRRTACRRFVAYIPPRYQPSQIVANRRTRSPNACMHHPSLVQRPPRNHHAHQTVTNRVPITSKPRHCLVPTGAPRTPQTPCTHNLIPHNQHHQPTPGF